MNAKKLKTLRKICRNAAALADAPIRALVALRGHNVRMVQAGINLDGTPRMEPFQYTGTLYNQPYSFRGLYRQHKKLGSPA